MSRVWLRKRKLPRQRNGFYHQILLGCFDENEYDKIPYEVVECKEHLELAQKMARESMVLLKNDGTLPLCKEKLNTIGVIGP